MDGWTEWMDEMAGRNGHEPPWQELVELVMRRMDRDRDGRIGREDWRAAVRPHTSSLENWVSVRPSLLLKVAREDANHVQRQCKVI
jgi:hypothetical protein